MGFLLIFLVGMAENGDFEWLRDATEEDIVFWKKFLNVKSDYACLSSLAIDG